MKTKILKWDVVLQQILIALNIFFLFAALLNHRFFYTLSLLIWLSCFIQIASNVIHLMLQHKSIGYTDLRHRYLGCAVIYIILVGSIFFKLQNDFLYITVIILIPEAALFSYYSLCEKELQYLQNREFHILR